MRLHHVQLGMPAGGEVAARRFYRDALGLTEVDRPATLAARHGCWFRWHDHGVPTLEIHLSVEESFVPSPRAHPAIVVADVAALEGLAARITAAGCELSWAERTTFPGYHRFHCRDPFGNRVEVLAPTRPDGPA